MTPATASDSWRVAALSMMSRDELERLASGGAGSMAPWVEAAAAHGVMEAAICLGRMKLAGEGVTRDERAAFACFSKAAESGDAEAHNMLGRCYEQGWGTMRDAGLAASHFRRAADKAHAWAQYNLGHLLLDGDGVPQDRAEAFRYYVLAAAQGHERAMNLAGRCCEEGWGTARDPAQAEAWYRQSAGRGYFRGCYNHASVLAARGCIEGARWWFKAALKTAPIATRRAILSALQRSPRPELRRLAIEEI